MNKGIWVIVIVAAFAAGMIIQSIPADATHSRDNDAHGGVIEALSVMISDLQERVVTLEEQVNPLPQVPNPDPTDHFTPVTFQLDLNNKIPGFQANWFSVTGGAQSFDMIDYRTGEDRDNKKTSGDEEFEEVEVVGPLVSGKDGSRAELLEWLNGWANGKGERVNASLELLDSQDAPVRTINYFDAIPCFYKPPSVRAGDESLLEERFSFKPERVEDESASNNPQDNENSFIPEIDDEVLVSSNFRFEIDGQQLEVVSVDPGPFRCELKDATMGNRQDNQKEFTVTKPSFDTWRVEKYYQAGDLHLKELFDSFAQGERKPSPSDSISLIYMDKEESDVRRINCFGYVPISYEPVNIDSRNAGQAATEVMEFSVLRCEYQ